MPSSTKPDSSGASPAPRPRPKRHQVVRACDRCRQHRTKCDTDIPCSNCKTRGLPCSNDSIRTTSLSQAQREIESLRRQVRDLERDLRDERARASEQLQHQSQAPIVPPPSISAATTPELLSSGVIEYGDLQKFCGGVHVGAARSSNKMWYGPSSLFHFLGRIAGFLSTSYQQASPATDVKNTTGILLDGPTKPPDRTTPTQRKHYGDPFSDGVYLTSRSQEEYFLDLFWQSYHTSLYPIVDEAEFKDDYRSLWSSGSSTRESSALVDIVLAMSMQFGVAMMPSLRDKLVVDSDSTVAGRWYYRRSQRLLEYELESPTLSTLQCHLLTATYLCCGTFHNMADNASGLAIRTAHMLGLHVDPPDTMPTRQRELRRRLWWAMYILDNKIAMKLGRPFLIQLCSVSPALPSDSYEVAANSGSDLRSVGDNATWLSFNLHQVRLIRAARTAYMSVYHNSIHVRDNLTIWDDPEALEAHAKLLKSHMGELDEWIRALPSSLIIKRGEKSCPYDIDCSPLDVDPFAALWIQRQQLLLELQYHNICTYLYRPFISFTQPAPSGTIAEEIARTCAFHAATATHMTHQALSTTSILAGWHEAFQWQWSASITLVGYILAYPQGAYSAEIRKALEVSITVFDIYGQSFAVAESAARIMREFSARVDHVIQQNLGKRETTDKATDKTADKPQQAADTTVANTPMANTTVANRGASMDQDALGEPVPAFKYMESLEDLDGTTVQEILEMAFNVDQWTDTGMLWPQGPGMMSLAQ